jgi:hypothetical protein
VFFACDHFALCDSRKSFLDVWLCPREVIALFRHAVVDQLPDGVRDGRKLATRDAGGKPSVLLRRQTYRHDIIMSQFGGKVQPERSGGSQAVPSLVE